MNVVVHACLSHVAHTCAGLHGYLFSSEPLILNRASDLRRESGISTAASDLLAFMAFVVYRKAFVKMLEVFNPVETK